MLSTIYLFNRKKYSKANRLYAKHATSADNILNNLIAQSGQNYTYRENINFDPADGLRTTVTVNGDFDKPLDYINYNYLYDTVTNSK